MDPLEDPEGLDDTAGAQRRALAEHARFVDANLKRNYTANFIHGVLGMTGFRLIYAPTIIPAYLLLLTGSTAAVGLGTALLQLGATISPIASGSRIEHRSHILPYAIGVGSMMRLMILGLALTGYFLTGNLLLIGTFACFVLLGFFTGAQRVAFQMLMSKLIPIRKRGRLQGYRNFAGGLIAALLAWAAGNYLIADKWLGNGYATTFLFAFLLTSAGLVVLKTMIREPAAPVSRPQMPMMQRIRQFPELLQDRDFAWFLGVQCFSTMARVGAPFWTIYAGMQLGLDGALIGGLSFVFLGSDTLSNVLWGPLGDRFGFKIIYVLALCSSVSGVTLLILGSTAVPIYAAFVLLGVGGSGWMLASTTMVLEFGEPQDTPMRLAFVTTLEGAIAASGPVIAGLLVAVSGFQPLFFIVLAAQIAALGLLIVKVREPRHRVGAV
ncbi:MFS transporter [Erythrobacter sp. YJ-T3-07]|uniref:MFS transporter n=1 Tax=Erythrobacter sp. YJ-T3-07 TaxID=2793063 RepID=UPI0018D2C9D2|nr:MFS transporter [Erythrobacter sp. YJ-T3-07]MBH1943841.1 MFS transporter [Erythrobacter sp. YJ-T3-07]